MMEEKKQEALQIEFKVEFGMLIFMDHIIEVNSIIGITSLYRKRLDELNTRLFFEIITVSNKVDVSINISALDNEEKNTILYKGFKGDYFTVKDLIHSLLKDRFVKSNVLGPI
jgi:hypothetical protein